MKIGVVIPVLNNYKGLAEAMSSLQTTHDWQPYVVPQWELQWPLSKAWNVSAKKAFDEGAEYVLIAGDDVVFSLWTVDALVGVLQAQEKSDKVALVTGFNVKEGIEDVVPPNEDAKKEDIYTWPKPTGTRQAEHPDFSCFMISRQTLDTIGLFDENFNPAYYEDNDYHRRIKLLGYKAVCTQAAPFYHERSTTLLAMTTEEQEAFKAKKAKSKEYYEKKWGALPPEETFSHPYNDPQVNPKIWFPAQR